MPGEEAEGHDADAAEEHPGVPLEALVEKFCFCRFEPSGWTKNPEIRQATSIVDYIFRWMALKFLPSNDAQAYKVTEFPGRTDATEDSDGTPGGNGHMDRVKQQEKLTFVAQADAPVCSDCGHLMVRNGNCYKCWNCGSTSGCS